MATAIKNRYRRTVKETNPYEVWISGDGTWVWLVLKKNQADDYKPYASAFCAVYSPHTFGGCDMGDTYLADIRKNAVQLTPGIGLAQIDLHAGRIIKLDWSVAEAVVGHKLTLTLPIEA